MRTFEDEIGTQIIVIIILPISYLTEEKTSDRYKNVQNIYLCKWILFRKFQNFGKKFKLLWRHKLQGAYSM